MTKRKAGAVQRPKVQEPAAKAHLRFDEDEVELADDGVVAPEAGSSSEKEDARASEEEDSDEDDEDDDDDEAPEAVSTVVGKRGARKQEQAVKDFEAATSVARKNANRVRDAKQKARAVGDGKDKAKHRAKAVESASDSEGSDDEPAADAEPQPVIPAQPTGTKRYLDPSIFADASSQLSKAAAEAAAKRAAEQKSAQKDRKKRRKIKENLSTRQVGDLTIQHLPRPSTVVPQPRHSQASSFLSRRLYGENRHATPKATLAAKRAEGQRRKTTGGAGTTAAARKRRAPAARFVRSS